VSETGQLVAIEAVLVLQLLGDAEAQRCRGREAAIGWARALTEQDFIYFEKLFADGDPLVKDSLIYALVLNGSTRAQSLLRRVYGARRPWGGPETVEEALSLIPVAEKAAKNLGAVPTEASVRSTAFYLSRGARRNAKVKIVGRSGDGKRMLASVSHSCGLLCGAGYLVVLRQEQDGWRYSLITMVWVS
jgi:hypothetical protein